VGSRVKGFKTRLEISSSHSSNDSIIVDCFPSSKPSIVTAMPPPTTAKNNNNKNYDDGDVVIVSALRTPLTRARKGGLATVPPSELLRTVLAATLRETNVRGVDVQDVCVGTVLTPPALIGTLRMAAIAAGIPETSSIQTVNRQCSSGLQAIATIANAIRVGEITIGIGAGVESMSLFPMGNNNMPADTPIVDWSVMQQHKAAMDCLIPMGVTSDTIVHANGLERHELDAFAVQSHQKAAAAQQCGKMHAEIVPVGSVDQDDGIRPATTMAVLSRLPPVFTPTGSTTAGNSSQTTDGAAAVLLMTRAEARRRHLPILAVWRGFAVRGVPPAVMGMGPAVAIPAVLRQAGLSIHDIDVFEINEAFASQALWCARELNVDMSKLNPSGGAIALGHPLGCTGARMIATLVQELRRRKGSRYGVVSMCIGTGMVRYRMNSLHALTGRCCVALTCPTAQLTTIALYRRTGRCCDH
jgi:acetyl-CoA acyltransferase 1